MQREGSDSAGNAVMDALAVPSGHETVVHLRRRSTKAAPGRRLQRIGFVWVWGLEPLAPNLLRLPRERTITNPAVEPVRRRAQWLVAVVEQSELGRHLDRVEGVARVGFDEEDRRRSLTRVAGFSGNDFHEDSPRKAAHGTYGGEP